MRGTVRPYNTPAGAHRFEYQIEVGVGADGKRKQARRRGFASEADARAAMEAELTDRRRGQFVDPDRTPLGGYLAEWLAATAPSRRPNTNRSLAACLARAAPLAAVPLGRLQPQQVQRWANDLAARLAPQTVRVTHAALSSALKQAVAWGHLPRNPAAGCRLPKPPPRREQRDKAWTADQAAAFLAAVAGDPWEPLWRLLLDGQLRGGEALALRWSDLDAEAGVVRVRRTLTRDAAGRWAVGDRPKTDESMRDVAIGAATATALRRQRAAVAEARRRAGPAWTDRDLVFSDGRGRWLNPSVARNALDRAVATAGVPRLTMHGLRHTGATLLVLAGVPLVVVSRRLGHGGIGVTSDVYAHVTPAADRAAAEALTAALA